LDLVIARYVLVHQVDPVGFLRTAARFTKSGGILALHEIVLDRPVDSQPLVGLWRQTADWLLTTFRSGAPREWLGLYYRA
jgi:ubiquinone/menaquinone biosynthesis C-methylase UbiE